MVRETGPGTETHESANRAPSVRSTSSKIPPVFNNVETAIPVQERGVKSRATFEAGSQRLSVQEKEKESCLSVSVQKKNERADARAERIETAIQKGGVGAFVAHQHKKWLAFWRADTARGYQAQLFIKELGFVVIGGVIKLAMAAGLIGVAWMTTSAFMAALPLSIAPVILFPLQAFGTFLFWEAWRGLTSQWFSRIDTWMPPKSVRTNHIKRLEKKGLNNKNRVI